MVGRWLRRYFSAFKAKPEDMESDTLDDPGSPLIVSAKYREAAARAMSPSGVRRWLCTKKLGGHQGWPNDRSIMKVGAASSERN